MRRAVDFLWWFFDFYEFVGFLSYPTTSVLPAKRILINVISFLIIVFGGVIFSSSKKADSVEKCTEYKRFNITIVDCSHLKRRSAIPDYLSANIQGLNVSHVSIRYDLQNDTFAKFKDSLLLLDNSNSQPPQNYEVWGIYYVVLTKLEYLDISDSGVYFQYLEDGRYQIFPPSLKILRICQTYIEYLNVSYLLLLKELHMRETLQKAFPVINIKAPIRYLDMANHTFYALSPMHFAPYCGWQEVVLDVEEGFGLNQPKYYCRCISLKNWFANKTIKAVMACTPPHFPPPECVTSNLVEANASAIYADHCLKPAKSLLMPVRGRWWLILVLILLLLLLTLLTIVFWVMFTTRRKAEQAQSEISETVLDEKSTEEFVEEEEEVIETLEESTDIMAHISPKAIAEMY